MQNKTRCRLRSPQISVRPCGSDARIWMSFCFQMKAATYNSHSPFSPLFQVFLPLCSYMYLIPFWFCKYFHYTPVTGRPSTFKKAMPGHKAKHRFFSFTSYLHWNVAHSVPSLWHAQEPSTLTFPASHLHCSLYMQSVALQSIPQRSEGAVAWFPYAFV